MKSKEFELKRSDYFENLSDEENSSIIKNSLFLLEEINKLQKYEEVGDFLKFKINNDSKHYEIAIGSSSIKVISFKLSK